MENSRTYYNGAGHLYSDTSSCGTVFERNILRGTATDALYHHCGLDNQSVNNIVHRTDSESFGAVWAGCGKKDQTRWRSQGSTSRPVTRVQRYTNHHNIYLFDSMEGLSMARTYDRYYDEAPGAA